MYEKRRSEFINMRKSKLNNWELDVETFICESLGAHGVQELQVLQTLWSGYGSIKRYALSGSIFETVIVKHVAPPDLKNHPRGWNTSLSHSRKLKSYAVEAEWYSTRAERCEQGCRVPASLGHRVSGAERIFLLEDLDAAGFSARCEVVDRNILEKGIEWLAHFHATFLGEASAGLWKQGSYWHLETRPDELSVLEGEDFGLWQAAPSIDRCLREAHYQTLIHGDAKLQNFCFLTDYSSIAAVDFQYVGGGCGVTDLAYFIGSCLDERQCEEKELWILERYFETLRTALEYRLSNTQFKALEEEWRGLYPVAWADFHRFLKGWSPGHWKVNAYSERLTRQVVSRLME